MRSLLFLSFSIFFELSVHSQTNSSPKFFEGIVEYDIKNESFLQGVSDNELKVRMGSRLNLYFKNGSYMREYLDDAGYTMRKVFFHKDSNMVYDYYPLSNPDTLYAIDPTEKTFESFSVEPGNSERVLNCDCPSVIIKARYTSPFLPDTGNLKLTYYFCKELPVDPQWQKDIYVWKDIIKEYKSIATKFIEDDPFFMKQTFTATKITWQEIPEKIFEINPDLILTFPPKF